LRHEPELRGTAEWLLLAAMVHWRLGEFQRSRGTALQARDRLRAAGDVDGEMRAENVAAAGAFATGDLQEAEAGFTRAMLRADELGDGLMTARCANNLGNVAYYVARHASALSFYRIANATFEQVGEWSRLAEGWLNSAIVLREAGDLEESRVAAERAVDYAERGGERRLFGQALAAAAETSVAVGDRELAAVQAIRALRLAREEEDALGEADALRVLCVVRRTSGDLDEALELGGQARNIAERIQHSWVLAEVLRDLGEVHLTTGDAPQAARCYDASADAFAKAGAAERADDLRSRARRIAGNGEA